MASTRLYGSFCCTMYVHFIAIRFFVYRWDYVDLVPWVQWLNGPRGRFGIYVCALCIYSMLPIFVFGSIHLMIFTLALAQMVWCWWHSTHGNTRTMINTTLVFITCVLCVTICTDTISHMQMDFIVERSASFVWFKTCRMLDNPGPHHVSSLKKKSVKKGFCHAESTANTKPAACCQFWVLLLMGITCDVFVARNIRCVFNNLTNPIYFFLGEWINCS